MHIYLEIKNLSSTLVELAIHYANVTMLVALSIPPHLTAFD